MAIQLSSQALSSNIDDPSVVCSTKLWAHPCHRLTFIINDLLGRGAPYVSSSSIYFVKRQLSHWKNTNTGVFPRPLPPRFCYFLGKLSALYILNCSPRKLLFFLSANFGWAWHHRGFALVSIGTTGIAHPLPAKLGPLPLYQDDDGFSSVLGPPLWNSNKAPEDQVKGSANHALAYSPVDISAILAPPRDNVFCLSSKCSGNRFATPFSVLEYIYPSDTLTQRIGPHTCSRSAYACNAPDCTRRTPFRTKQALNRHYEGLHLGERFDCPVPGCENIGEKGIKRYDNLVAHMRNKHGVSQTGGSGGN